MTTPNTGWGVFVNDDLFMDTVSPTRHGAIANFLLAERGILIMRSDAPEEIENAWQKKKGRAEVHEVTVSRADGEDQLFKAQVEEDEKLAAEHFDNEIKKGQL